MEKQLIMDLLEPLKSNKGTVSSALGKELAEKALGGDTSILEQAINFATYDLKNVKSKNVRAGAAKIVEIVAEKRPDLVASHLEKLLPALAVNEPQTRWMIIRTMGFCASKNESVASKAIQYADKYITGKKNGQLCLVSSADLFLGDYGAISKSNAKQVFPILEKSIANVILNESDWILEALIKMVDKLDLDEREIAMSFARINAASDRKSTQKRAMKILKQDKE